MNYNIETINGLAQQLAEIFKVAVMERQKAGTGTPLIAEIENGMREALRQIGKQALGMFLSSMQATPGSEIDCPCGGELRYQRMRAAKVISVFGRVTYERVYYAADASAGLARCRQAQRQQEAAWQEAQYVWDYTEHRGEKGMEFPILAYITCADIFESHGDGEKALTAIQVGYRVLMERADKISDPDWRKSFLENVPEHLALIEMWEGLSRK